MPDLSQSLDAATFASLSLYRTADGWQSNLNIEGGNSWRVCHGPTPAAALAALFEPVPVWVPPFPASLPPLPY